MNIRSTRLALAAAALVAGLAQAQTVAPPPLPIGSMQARPDPGMSEPERKRYVRAHHHKAHHRKDYTKDDSVPSMENVSTETARPAGARPGDAGASGAGAGPRTGGTVQDGRGTGPAREQTDRGAGSWFFGNDKK